MSDPIVPSVQFGGGSDKDVLALRHADQRWYPRSLAALLTELGISFGGGGGSSTPVACRAAMSSDLTTTNDGNRYFINFDTVLEDASGLVSTVSSHTRFTIPATGYYQVGLNAQLKGAFSATYFALALYINGTFIRDFYEVQNLSVASSSMITAGGTPELLYLNTSDYIELAYWCFGAGGTPKIGGLVGGSGSTQYWTTYAYVIQVH